MLGAAVSISYGEVHSFPQGMLTYIPTGYPVSISYGEVHSFPRPKIHRDRTWSSLFQSPTERFIHFHVQGLQALKVSQQVSISYGEVHSFPPISRSSLAALLSGFNLLRRGSFISTQYTQA